VAIQYQGNGLPRRLRLLAMTALLAIQYQDNGLPRRLRVLAMTALLFPVTAIASCSKALRDCVDTPASTTAPSRAAERRGDPVSGQWIAASASPPRNDGVVVPGHGNRKLLESAV
jgi:hypothetical protein